MLAIKKVDKIIQKFITNNDVVLDLSGLGLTKIPVEVFKIQSRIKHLKLSNNQIKCLKGIAQLNNVEILWLNYNSLTVLPLELCEMSHLKFLNLWSNNLQTIPKELSKLEKLEHLLLGYNHLEELPRDIFSFLSHLKSLDIQGNPFSMIPILNELNEFDLMTYLRSKDSCIKIIEVPKAFKTPLQQYLNFFPDFVELVSGKQLQLKVLRTNLGLKILTDSPQGLDILKTQRCLNLYISFLNDEFRKNQKLNDLALLKLETQIQHFKLQIRQIEFENEYLKGLIDKIINLQVLHCKEGNKVEVVQNMVSQSIQNSHNSNVVNLHKIPITNEFRNLTTTLGGEIKCYIE